MLTIPRSFPPSTTGICRTRWRVIWAMTLVTLSSGPQVTTDFVITWDARIPNSPAPCSARLWDVALRDQPEERGPILADDQSADASRPQFPDDRRDRCVGQRRCHA